jgi:N-acetylmuramoyl-L-alanine amidase
VVVLDPGHGGDDFGTSGKLGKKAISEKEIALGIAIRTQRILRDPLYSKPLGRSIVALLTRDRDREVSLEKRAEIARSKNADLFVSIHANSDPHRQAQGIETYFLNNTDGSATSKLVEIENRTSRKYKNAKPASLLIRSVAADATVDSSREAAELVHKSVVDHLHAQGLNLQDRGVRQALLYVLLDAQVPGILFEAFFLSHPRDLAFVAEGENRQKIAEGLAKGILRFLALR